MITPLESNGSRRTWRDPDDAPKITDQWIAEANLYHGKKLVTSARDGLTNSGLEDLDRDFKA